MNKFYTATKEFNGKTITAQFNGLGASLKAIDDSYIEDSSNTSIEKLAKYLFEHVVVEPKMKIEDFGADKIGETKTKVINGKEYTAKFNGILTAIRSMDTTYIEGSSNTSTEKFAEYIFEKVIVTPEKLSMDDFETMDEFNEVVAFAREVMQGGEVWKDFMAVFNFAKEVMKGNFRETKDSVSTGKGSKG